MELERLGERLHAPPSYGVQVGQPSGRWSRLLHQVRADPLPPSPRAADAVFQRSMTLSGAWTGCHTSLPSSLPFPTRAAPPYSSFSPPDPMLESTAP